MRSAVRQLWVIRLAASLVAVYLRLTYLTLRWTHEGRERAEGVWAQPGQGAMMCFWHARIPLSPTPWDKHAPQTLYALVSKSADGELITQIVARLGFPSIRGSRADEDSRGEKGGASAFREMVKWIKGGNAMAITPDGPKGPAQIMGEGTPMLARVTGAQVLLIGMACHPCIRFKSWDRTVFPLPFGKAALVWDGPFTAGRDDDPVELAKLWGDKLNAVTERAEALVQ